jgi:ABC-type transport system involved in multi-copper enzyme maturation permease subunit
MKEIGLLAWLTWREAQRRKIVWVAVALGAAFIALYSVGLHFAVLDLRSHLGDRQLYVYSGFSFLTTAGFYVISFMGVMLSVLASVGTLAGEISSHTIYSLVVKPYPRGFILIGKWLGLSLMLSLYLAALWGGVTAVTWGISGYVPPRILAGLGLVILQAEVMLALSIYGGTRLSTVTNGVVCFMMYGLAFTGSWLEQFGSMMHNETLVDIGIISSLVVPSEVMWRMASYLMQPSVINSLQLSPFAITTPPSAAMLVYAVLYVAAMLALGLRALSRRDL